MTMATNPSRRPLPDHPLLQERARLEAILDVMYIQIQKELHHRRAPVSRAGARAGRGDEQGLPGGESADDVLQKAAVALLSYPPSELTTTWEALAVGIAQNKAKGSLRLATRGRRSSADADDVPDRINLVPLSSDDDSIDLIDSLPADEEALEREFIESRQQQVLLRLARELLDDRERRIYFDIHHLGINKAEVGRTLGLTGQRVGQIYHKVAERLLNAAHNDPTFRMLSNFTERRTP